MPKNALNAKMKTKPTGFHFLVPTSLRTEEHIFLLTKRFFSYSQKKKKREE
jgi:hypothetical protein